MPFPKLPTRTLLIPNRFPISTKDPAGQNVVQDTAYNAFGQVTSQNAPYRAGGSGPTTSYTYDVLGRPTAVNPATGGQITYQYTGNTSLVTDQEGKRKQYTYNDFGKVSTVTEEDSSGNLTQNTTYQYDTLGRLIQIVQGVQTRSFAYDSLGRLTSETNPESGTMTYTYDDNGNRLTRTDARGIVTTSTYDVLNRETGRSHSDGTPAATFSYDQSTSSLIGLITNGKGRMTSAWTSDGIGYSWSFDAAGRTLQQVFSIDGITYPVGYSYTDAGCGCQRADLTSITYPNGFQISYTRDAASRITAIRDNGYWDYGNYTYGPLYYVGQVSYNAPNGSVSTIQYPTGTTENLSLDGSGRLSSHSITNYQTYQYNQQVYYSLNLSYGYGLSGRINDISDSESFWAGYPGVQYYTANDSSYAYDRWGRLGSYTHRYYMTPGNYWVVDYSSSYSYDRYVRNDPVNLVDPDGKQIRYSCSIGFSYDPSIEQCLPDMFLPGRDLSATFSAVAMMGMASTATAQNYGKSPPVYPWSTQTTTALKKAWTAAQDPNSDCNHFLTATLNNLGLTGEKVVSLILKLVQPGVIVENAQPDATGAPIYTQDGHIYVTSLLSKTGFGNVIDTKSQPDRK